MIRVFCLASLISLLAMGDALSAGSAAKDILDRHVAAMKSGNLNGVMADYADDAVAIAPHGIAPNQKAASTSDVFVGKQNVQTLFRTLTSAGHLPANRSMETRYEPRGKDVVLMYWVQERGTPRQASGVDIFVIRDGKIEFQDVTIDPAKP